MMNKLGWYTLLIVIPYFIKVYQPVGRGLTITTVIFIGLFAVGACIFTGFFSVNESKDVVTTASKIHGAGSTIGFIISIVFFVLFVMSDKPEFANTIIIYEGLWQRLNLLFMYAPLAVIAVKKIIAL